MIRTVTGFDEMPAATVWNGPGRPRETWKRYEPSRRMPIEATRVMPRMRLTRVPGLVGESRPAKSTTWPNFVAPGAPSVAVVLAGPVEGVEVGGVRAAVVAVDPDEPVVVLVCGPPAATSPGASERVHLAGAAPAAVAAAVDDVRAPPELLSAISPGGLSGRR